MSNTKKVAKFVGVWYYFIINRGKEMKNKKVRKINIYIISGIITTLISWVSFKLLLFFNMQYIIAFSISWILAVTYAYFSTRKKVYDSAVEGKKNVFKEYLRFGLGRVATYLINLVLLFICVDILYFDEFISNCAITVIIVILNFFIGNLSINKKWRVKL